MLTHDELDTLETLLQKVSRLEEVLIGSPLDRAIETTRDFITDLNTR